MLRTVLCWPKRVIRGGSVREHLGMRSDEMLESNCELLGMAHVAAPACGMDVSGNHRPYGRTTSRLIQQVLAERRGRDLGNVLMLSERKHLISRQSAQRKAIFERDHGVSSGSDRYSNCFGMALFRLVLCRKACRVRNIRGRRVSAAEFFSQAAYPVFVVTPVMSLDMVVNSLP